MKKEQRLSKRWRNMQLNNKDREIYRKRTSKNLPMTNKLKSAKMPTSKNLKPYVRPMSWNNKRKTSEITRKISKRKH